MFKGDWDSPITQKEGWDNHSGGWDCPITKDGWD